VLINLSAFLKEPIAHNKETASHLAANTLVINCYLLYRKLSYNGSGVVLGKMVTNKKSFQYPGR
jgi:hypothetical protein